jgi:ribosomal protein S18 acetylase RimI-like enzyme
MSLKDVRRLPPMPSEYVTDRVFRLDLRERADGKEWRLETESLATPLHKRYDEGTVAEWLEANEDAGPQRDLRFLAAVVGRVPRALVTWRAVPWNQTLWLVDIRTAPEWQRRGLGTGLIERLKETARELRLRGITVETQTTNYPAVSFYRKQGFTIAGLHERLYTNSDVEVGEVALFLFCPVP